MRFGEEGEASGFKGKPRFRVNGASITRCESVSFPFPILRGVKSAEAAPFGASSFDAMPFPGTVATAGSASMELISFMFSESKRKKRNESTVRILKI